MSTSAAFPSLVALRQALLRRAAARPSLHLARASAAVHPSTITGSSSASASRSGLHTSVSLSNGLESQPIASTSAASSPPPPSQQPPATSSALSSNVHAYDANVNLDSLFAEFGVDPSENPELFAEADEANIQAVPTRPSLVHVRLSYLAPSTKPAKNPPPVPKAVAESSTAHDVTAAADASSTSATETTDAANAAADATDVATTSAPSSSSRRVRSARYVPLSAHVFDAPARRDVLHSAVVYYLDAQRSGTASTKTRSDVRGSKKKLRPQKGSGRARLGTMSNPILRGGAVAHGPKPRDHSTQLPRRVRELALRSALSARWREGNLIVVPSLEWIAPPRSTGPLARLLSAKQWTDALFLTAPRNPAPSSQSLESPLDRPSSSDPVYTAEQRTAHARTLDNFVRASNNLPRIELVELDALTDEAREMAKDEAEKKRPGELHAYEVLKRKKVICDLGAIEWLEEKLGGAIWHEQAALQGFVGQSEGSEEGEQQLFPEQEEALREEDADVQLRGEGPVTPSPLQPQQQQQQQQ